MSDNNSQEAANIFIRNLQPEDHEMLSKLREILHKKSNTQAVMTASYRYLDLLDTEQRLNTELRQSQMTIQRLEVELDSLKKQVARFLHIDYDKAQMAESLMTAITQQPDQEEKEDTDE